MNRDAEPSGVSFRVRGRVGFATLNRPEALNALSLEMVEALARRLTAWERDPRVEGVVLKGAGGRAFCAGGDVRRLYEAGRNGDLGSVGRFFREEYRLDLLVARYSKPVAALLDGVVMGGGVGLTIHCPYRLVTERTRLAMPETGLGFFPDVGSSFFLPRLSGRSGLYLALTGTRLGPGELLARGAATHYLPSDHLAEWERCVEAEGLAAPSQRLADAPPAPGPEARLFAEVESCFSSSSLEGILQDLANAGRSAAALLETLGKKSPMSLKVTFRQLTAGAADSLEEALRMEYRLCGHFFSGHDFYEGVRALLVDRDRLPRWRPDRVNEVREEDVDAYFGSAPGGFPSLDL